MAFAEVRINDGLIIYGTEGGAEYSTDIVTLNSGFEQRNQNWVNGRGNWNLGDRVVQQPEADTLNAFFRARKGKAIGFRFKDWLDYKDGGNGKLATANATNTPSNLGVGNGYATYQMYKVYQSGTGYDYRKIAKPVAGTSVIKRNGNVVTAGGGAGQYSLDTTTGLVTFTADASSAASAIAVGATTSVTLAANPGTLLAGEKLFLNGFTGANAIQVNGIAHTINSVSGAGPFVFILATTTSGTITIGAGTGYAYPQANDTLFWTGEFDVPVRFDTDKFLAKFQSAVISSPGVVSSGNYYISRLPILEIPV